MNPKTKFCPYCCEEILARAFKCKHCHEWLTLSYEQVIEKIDSLFPEIQKEHGAYENQRQEFLASREDVEVEDLEESGEYEDNYLDQLTQDYWSRIKIQVDEFFYGLKLPVIDYEIAVYLGRLYSGAFPSDKKIFDLIPRSFRTSPQYWLDVANINSLAVEVILSDEFFDSSKEDGSFFLQLVTTSPRALLILERPVYDFEIGEELFIKAIKTFPELYFQSESVQRIDDLDLFEKVLRTYLANSLNASDFMTQIKESILHFRDFFENFFENQLPLKYKDEVGSEDSIKKLSNYFGSLFGDLVQIALVTASADLVVKPIEQEKVKSLFLDLFGQIEAFANPVNSVNSRFDDMVKGLESRVQSQALKFPDLLLEDGWNEDIISSVSEFYILFGIFVVLADREITQNEIKSIAKMSEEIAGFLKPEAALRSRIYADHLSSVNKSYNLLLSTLKNSLR